MLKGMWFRMCWGGLLILMSMPVLSNPTQTTKMQKVKMASPMPNLMMLAKMNADALALDNEQLAILSDWRREHQARTQQLVLTIHETEALLHDMALEGMNQSEMNALREDLMSARSELIGIKYRCVENLRASFDDEQWTQLMQLYRQTQRAMNQDVAKGNEVRAFLRASPMPKLMAVIIMHEAELGLTEAQKQQLEAWRLKNMNHWALLFDEVLRSEKQLTQAALSMRPAEDLIEEYDAVLRKRQEMARMSLGCRDHVKKVLDDSQWAWLIKQFKAYM